MGDLSEKIGSDNTAIESILGKQGLGLCPIEDGHQREIYRIFKAFFFTMNSKRVLGVIQTVEQ